MADADNDEERLSLLHNDGSVPETSHYQSKRDKAAADAVTNLHNIVLVIGIVVIIVACFVTINQFYDGVIPVWALFLVLWIGHFLIFCIGVSSVRLMLQSMVPKNSRERFTQKWHQANERRISLLQFAIYNITWIFLLSIVLIIAEVLVYLTLIGVTDSYSALIVPYIIISVSLCNSFVCRSTSAPFAFTWIFLLLFCVGVNYRLTIDTSFSWIFVLSPIVTLFVYWLLYTIVLLLKHAVNQVDLKQYQLDSLILFAIGFVLLSMTGVVSMEVLSGSLVFGAYGSGIASILALAGGMLCFFAVYMLTCEQLSIVVERMGSERPVMLAKNAEGEWDKNQKRGFSVYPCVGEVEFNRDYDVLGSHSNDSFDVFACGCWSGTIELASIAFGNGRQKRSSDTDQ